MVRALFPGSFDPITLGLVDLVERGLAMFESLTIAVASNSAKRGVFSLDERLELIRGALPSDPRLETCVFDGLVVDYCRKHGIGAILRGLRTVSDFEYEYQMALTNRSMAPDVETVFVMPSVQNSFISSTLIKEIARHGGDISKFVPAVVAEQLSAKLQSK